MHQIEGNGIPADRLGAVAWRKSLASNPSGDCIEVAALDSGAVAVRNSRDPHGPALVYTRAQCVRCPGGKVLLTPWDLDHLEYVGHAFDQITVYAAPHTQVVDSRQTLRPIPPARSVCTGLSVWVCSSGRQSLAYTRPGSTSSSPSK